MSFSFRPAGNPAGRFFYMGVEQTRIREDALDTSLGGARPGCGRAGHGEKKASAEAFLRRDPVLIQKPIFLFRKNDTKTYHFLFPLPDTEEKFASNTYYLVQIILSNPKGSSRYRSRTASFCTHTFPSFINGHRDINALPKENPA